MYGTDRWDFMRVFRAPRRTPRTPFAPWLAAAERDAQAARGARWDAKLADLGGDPSRDDWRQFRPLRLVTTSPPRHCH